MLTDVDQKQLSSLSREANHIDPAVGLRAAAALRRVAEQLELEHVRRARAHGWSWREIAAHAEPHQASRPPQVRRPRRRRLLMLEQFTPEARAALESTTGLRDRARPQLHRHRAPLARAHRRRRRGRRRAAHRTRRDPRRGRTRDPIPAGLARHRRARPCARSASTHRRSTTGARTARRRREDRRADRRYEPDANVPLQLSRVTPRTRTVLEMAEHTRADERHVRRPLGGDARRGRRSRRDRVGAARRVASGVASRSGRDR